MTGTTPFNLVLSRQEPGPTTLFTSTALLTDYNVETLLKALCLQPLSKMAEMRYNADKQTKAGQNGTTDNMTSGYEKEHDYAAVRWYTLTTQCCQRPQRTKCPWDHFQNYFHTPLDLMASIPRLCTQLLLSRIEFQPELPQTKNR